MSLPRVVLGIIPDETEFCAPTHNFIMFDSNMVQVETISAELTITQPSEIALYDKVFQTIKEQAVYGQDVRTMIAAVMDGLRSDHDPHT